MPLIEQVLGRLQPQVAALIVVGRSYRDEIAVPDRPEPGLGPLGGLNAALAYACAHNFDHVLTTGCDLLDIPRDLATRLGAAPAFARGQPLLALWPAALATTLDAHLRLPDRSLHGWVAAVQARAVDLGTFVNVNTPGDLRADPVR